MQYSASPELINAIIRQESRGNPNALSPAGAMGLMQIMPNTAKQPGYGVKPLDNPWDPAENKRFGTDYFNAMLNKFGGDRELALIAYNAGPGNAQKFLNAGRDYSALPRRNETEPYVNKILASLTGGNNTAAQSNPFGLSIGDEISGGGQAQGNQVAPFGLSVGGNMQDQSVPGLLNNISSGATQENKSGPNWLNRNSDALLALSSGILQGRTWGQGLGKGFELLSKVGANKKSEAVKKMLLQLQLKNLQLRNQAAENSLNQNQSRQNATLNYLKSQGMGDDQADFLSTNPAALQNFLSTREKAQAKDQNLSYLQSQGVTGDYANILANNPKLFETFVKSRNSGTGGPFKDASDRIKTTQGLRKEFSGISKNYITVRDAINRIEASAIKPSPSGDIAMIFNFMKLLDPGSTVREGEYATVRNSASIPERIRAQYNRVVNGETLTKKMRNDYLIRSRGLFKVQEQQYIKTREGFSNIITRMGVDPKDVIIDYTRSSIQKYKGQSWKYKGGDRSDPNSWERVTQ